VAFLVCLLFTSQQNYRSLQKAHSPSSKKATFGHVKRVIQPTFFHNHIAFRTKKLRQRILSQHHRQGERYSVPSKQRSSKQKH